MGIDSGALVGALRCDDVFLLAGGGERPAPDIEGGVRREMWVGAYSLAGDELWSVFGPPGAVDDLGYAYLIAVGWDGDAIVGGDNSTVDASNGLWLGRFAGG